MTLLRRFIVWHNRLEPRAYWWVAEFFIRRGMSRDVFTSYPREAETPLTTKRTSDDRYRPCENPACLAWDSSRCAFRIGWDGQVVPSQREAAQAAGCRVVRFVKE